MFLNCNLLLIFKIKKKLTTNKNDKLNESRESVNQRIAKYAYAGKSKSRSWNARRRFRTI